MKLTYEKARLRDKGLVFSKADFDKYYEQYAAKCPGQVLEYNGRVVYGHLRGFDWLCKVKAIAAYCEQTEKKFKFKKEKESKKDEGKADNEL